MSISVEAMVERKKNKLNKKEWESFQEADSMQENPSKEKHFVEMNEWIQPRFVPPPWLQSNNLEIKIATGIQGSQSPLAPDWLIIK